MKSAVLYWFFCGIWVIMLFCSVQAEKRSLDKRYLAALAKNNRLPKFSYIHKKSEELDDEPSLDETGLLVNQIVEPNNVFDETNVDIASFPEFFQDDFLESLPFSKVNLIPSVDKRNVAALARLGRLNTLRYGGRFQPHYVSGKRVINENDNEEDYQEITNNEIDGNDVECEPYEGEDTISEIADEVNGRQKKRYVAALARSGRLPIWHSQRMWSGKRDYPNSLYKTNSRLDVENNLDNFIVEVPSYTRKQVKCKRISQNNRQKRDVDKIEEIENIPVENINLSGMSNQEEKRNLAALARNGKLPSRYFGNDKRDDISDENDTSDISVEEKRNIASLARNGKLFNSRVEGKRNIASLARNGKLVMNSNLNQKRNIASLAKNGKLPSFGKRNLEPLEEIGELPIFYDSEGKRNLAALARNGKLPSFYNANDKRNIQALARNNKLPAFTNDKRDSMESDEKRNMAALAKNGRLPSFAHIDDKRNLAALAKNGKLPTFGSVDDKRNVAALARNGKLPMFDSREEKRNMAALAKNGRLPSFYSSEEKRNIAALAKNGKLPSLYHFDDKRNIAALARNNKFPAFNLIEDKREIIPVSADYNEENKRNIAALARKGHLTHFNNQEVKRNIAALARNGKLLGYNKKDVYTTNSLNPLEKWDDMIFEDITKK